MRKRFLMPFIVSSFLLAGASVGTYAIYQNKVNEIVVIAEDEANSEEVVSSEEEIGSSQEEVVASNEEQSKVDEVIAKAKEILNYQFLGTTIGAILGGLICLGMSYLMKRIERDEINKLTDLSRNSRDNYQKFLKEAEEMTAKYNDLQQSHIDFMNETEKVIKGLEEQNKNLVSSVEEYKKARLEEREILLSIIAHNKDNVANGLAEELMKAFQNRK